MDIFLLFVGIILIAKRHYAWVFVITIGFFTSFYGLGTNISNGHNTSDIGIILFTFLFFRGLFIKKRYHYKIFDKSRLIIYIFAVFLCISIAYDLLNGSNIIWVLKTSRHWIVLFLAMPIITFFPPNVYQKVIKYIFYISIVGSVFILSDHFLGTNILGKTSTMGITENGIVYERGLMPTTFATFYILLLFTDHYKILNLRTKTKNLCLFILTATVIASMIRSFILSILLGVFFVLFRTGKIKLKRLPQISFVIIVLFVLMSNTEGLSDRMTKGFEELTSLSKSTNNIEVEGNITFRVAVYTERAEYINEDMARRFFGVGNIPEEEFPNIFKIGLSRTHGFGDVMQLDTGDIAWAVLVVRLGFLGMFIFILFLTRLLHITSRLSNPFAIVSLTYMFIMFALLSFSGTSITHGYFYVFIFMIIALSETYSNLNKTT